MTAGDWLAFAIAGVGLTTVFPTVRRFWYGERVGWVDAGEWWARGAIAAYISAWFLFLAGVFALPLVRYEVESRPLVLTSLVLAACGFSALVLALVVAVFGRPARAIPPWLRRSGG